MRTKIYYTTTMMKARKFIEERQKEAVQ